MKVTKLLILIFLLFMVLIRKDAQAISTELFGCPTAYTLKKGELLIGGFYLIGTIFTHIGLLNNLELYLEIEGLMVGFNSGVKFKIFEKENYPTISIGTGWKFDWWDRFPPGVMGEIKKFWYHYLTFSINKTYIGVLKGENPWLRTAGRIKDFCWIGNSIKLNKNINLNMVGLISFNNLSRVKYGFLLGPEFIFEKYFFDTKWHIIKSNQENSFRNIVSFSIGYYYKK